MFHLYEEKLSSETLYNGRIMTVTRDTVLLENGKTADREVVHHSGGVCIAPLDDEGNLYFVRQFRYPFHDVLLELPAGKREKGETPIECGIRELKEEVGFKATEIIPLGEIYPTPAYDDEVIYLFLAKGRLVKDVQSPDEDEFLDVVKMSLSEAKEKVMNGEIKDGKTQIAILKIISAFNKVN